jgi:hypothetical protein
MAKASANGKANGNGSHPVRAKARTGSLTGSGVGSTGDMVRILTTLMDDLANGRIDYKVAGQINNSAGQVIKTVSTQMKYAATFGAAGGSKQKQLDFITAAVA